MLKAANHLKDSADMTLIRRQSEEYYAQALKDGSHAAYLVYDGGMVVGAGGISFFRVMPTCHNPTGKKGYIMNMYTNPGYRHRGIAYKMLDFLVMEARSRGIRHISLETTEMGRPLYEKYGFAGMKNEMEMVEKDEYRSDLQ